MKRYLLFLVLVLSFCFNWNRVEAKSIISREEKGYAGLDYNRFRYYSPEEGLYISQDPIGLQGGDKFYSYVHDPNRWIDPLGLASKTYGKDDLNVDTGTARAIMDGSSHDIDSSIKDKNLIMTQTAVDELNAYGERSNRKQEVQNFLDSNNVNIVPDNPSDRAKNLPTTRKIGDNDKIIFGTGDSMGITTITSDAKFVSASSAHGVDFDVIVHSPVSTK